MRRSRPTHEVDPGVQGRPAARDGLLFPLELSQARVELGVAELAGIRDAGRYRPSDPAGFCRSRSPGKASAVSKPPASPCWCSSNEGMTYHLRRWRDPPRQRRGGAVAGAAPSARRRSPSTTSGRCLELPGRTAEQDDEMIHAAHASRAINWGQVGTKANLARGEWQVSRVYTALDRAGARPLPRPPLPRVRRRGGGHRGLGSAVRLRGPRSTRRGSGRQHGGVQPLRADGARGGGGDRG